MNNNKKKNPSKGYIAVASRKKSFLYSACNLLESIKEYDENAQTCLFTEQKWIDENEMNFDDIDYVFPTPGSWFREKLYGCANSPFDQTFYIDADCEVIHEDILKVHDHLDGHDICFVELKKEQKRHFAEFDWNDGKDWLKYCGGVVLYDKRNPLVVDFMNDWHDVFKKQDSGSWWPGNQYPKSLSRWDQFTLWWLLEKEEKYQSLKVKFFEDNYRWNYFTSFGITNFTSYNYGVVDPVIIHNSTWLDKDGKKGYFIS